MKFYINRKKPFRLLFFRGSHSWELQVAKHVFQLRHRDWKAGGWGNANIRKFHYFTD